MKNILFIILLSLLNFNLTAMDQENLNEALTSAMNEERWEEVRNLIDQGAHINTQDSQGNTALHQAAFWGDMKTVIFLLKKGAATHLQNKKGRTPADLAKKSMIEYSVPEMVEKFTAIYQLLMNDDYK